MEDDKEKFFTHMRDKVVFKPNIMKKKILESI